MKLTLTATFQESLYFEILKGYIILIFRFLLYRYIVVTFEIQYLRCIYMNYKQVWVAAQRSLK